MILCSRVGLLLSLALLGSCASLRTEVRVLDQSQIDPLEILLESVPRMRARASRALSSDGLDDARTELLAQVQARIDAWTQGAQAMVASADVAGLKQNLASFLGAPVQDARTAYEQGISRALEAEGIPVQERTKKRHELLVLLYGARDAFMRGDAELARVITSVKTVASDLETIAKGKASGDSQKETAIAQRARELADELVSLAAECAAANSINAAALINDARLAMVVNAPEDCWRSVQNRVWAAGNLGNVDIAVIKENVGEGAPGVEGVPEFNLKGVRLDSGSVTRATFQGVKEMLRVASSLAGVPLPDSGGAGASSGSSQPGGREREEQAAEDKTTVRRMTAQLMDSVLVLSRDAVDKGADDARRKASIDQIKAAVADFRAAVEGIGAPR